MAEDEKDWDAYWESLTPEQKAQEQRMMDAHTSQGVIETGETREQRRIRINDKDEVLRNNTTMVCFTGNHNACAAHDWCLCECHPAESLLTGQPPKPRADNG